MCISSTTLFNGGCMGEHTVKGYSHSMVQGCCSSHKDGGCHSRPASYGHVLPRWLAGWLLAGGAVRGLPRPLWSVWVTTMCGWQTAGHHTTPPAPSHARKTHSSCKNHTCQHQEREDCQKYRLHVYVSCEWMRCANYESASSQSTSTTETVRMMYNDICEVLGVILGLSELGTRVVEGSNGMDSTTQP